MKAFSTYVIFCGMPRCGTRQFADLLDRDDRVCLQGEIKQNIVPYIHDLVMAADASYIDGKQVRYYNNKRGDAVMELFAYFSKTSRSVKSGAIIHGFKTPNIEFHHDKLSAIFLPSTRRLNYLYCIRNIKDCYLSLTSMPWFKRTQEQFITRYIKSLETAIVLHEVSNQEQSRIDIGVLNLDSYISAQHKADWVVRNIYRPVGLDISAGQATEIVTTTENRNATEKATGKIRPTSVPDDVHAIFMRHKKVIDNAVADFNSAFGEHLQSYGV